MTGLDGNLGFSKALVYFSYPFVNVITGSYSTDVTAILLIQCSNQWYLMTVYLYMYNNSNFTILFLNYPLLECFMNVYLHRRIYIGTIDPF